ncbi:A1 cistron-splicing factor [Elaphomyces granulatus]
MAATRPSPTPTLLAPHLPPKTFVGIDLISFTSTPNFHGIKDLPEGWHFLYTGTSESFSLRCGAWFYVGDVRSGVGTNDSTEEDDDDDDDEKQVIRRQQNVQESVHAEAEIRIWKWDHNTEALIPLDREKDSDQQEAVQHKANLGALWQRGALFRYRSRVPSSKSAGSHGKQERERDRNDRDIGDEDEETGRSDWVGLTNRLSPGLLTRVLCDPDIDVDGRPSWTVTSASTSFQDADQIPGLTGKEYMDGLAGGRENELRFLPIDLKRTWPDGAIGRERTVAAQDRSWALGNFIEQLTGSAAGDHAGEAQILGELQFAFLMVLTLMNYSCLQQWKRLLSLTLTCRAAIRSRERFFADVLRLLMLQLKHSTDVEGGLFELDNDDGAAFLIQLLTCFRRSLDEIQDDAALTVKSQMEELETWVQKEFGWGFRREDIVRRGMLELEDGEQIEVQISGADEEDETGEYAPVVVDLGENGPTLDDVGI